MGFFTGPNSLFHVNMWKVQKGTSDTIAKRQRECSCTMVPMVDFQMSRLSEYITVHVRARQWSITGQLHVHTALGGSRQNYKVNPLCFVHPQNFYNGGNLLGKSAAT